MYFVIDTKQMQAGINRLNRKLGRIPDQMGEATYEVAKKHQRNLRTQLSLNKSRDTDTLYLSIQAKKLNNKESIVEMADYGIDLDSMRPHFVSTKNPGVQEWILKKFGNPMRPNGYGRSRIQFNSYGYPVGALYVTPHPFIAQATARTEKAVARIMTKRLNIALSS